MILTPRMGLICQICTLLDVGSAYGTLNDSQVQWSTIEKVAYTINWALLRLDDLVGGVYFKRMLTKKDLAS